MHKFYPFCQTLVTERQKIACGPVGYDKNHSSTLVKVSNSVLHQGIQPEGVSFHMNLDDVPPNSMNLMLSQKGKYSSILVKTSWDRSWDFKSGCIKSSTNPFPIKTVPKWEKTGKNNNK